MAIPIMQRELPLLEVLDAASDHGIPAGRVQLVGLRLHRDDLLASGEFLELDADANGKPHNKQLSTSIFEAVDRGLVRREGTRYYLTSAGQAVLSAHGLRANEDARSTLQDALAEDNGAG